LVGFLDDDGVLPRTWVGNALTISAGTGARIFGGPYFPVYTSQKPAWFKDHYASGQYGDRSGWLGERQYLFAANLVIERALFLELGGFSTELGPGTRFFYGEETDLQHRAAQKGVRVWYDPGLSIQHHTSPAKMSPGWFLSNSWQKGLVKARIFRGDFSSGKTSKTRLQASWLRRAIQDALQAVLLILLLPFRSRASYPFYENFVIEAICPRISSLAMLLSLVRDA
jgi:GT2 family glycosyltransferase